MEHTPTVDTYALRRVDDTHWQILNEAYSPYEPGHVVASLHESGEWALEVIWIQPTPLPTRYAMAADALDDLNRWSRRPRGGERPVPIAHFPPTGPLDLPGGHAAAR